MEKSCKTCKYESSMCVMYCDESYSGWEPKKPPCKTCAKYPGEGVYCGAQGDCWEEKDGKSDSMLDNPKIVAGVKALLNPENHLSDTQKLINDICDEVKNILLEKNRKYGDSAINPKRVFSKASPIEQINVRLDDKLSRIMSAQDDDTEDAELDLIGYLILKRVAKRVAHDVQ